MMNLEKVGQGMTTIVYRDAYKAIKLYPVGTSLEAIENEMKWQKQAHTLGIPVPEVYGINRFDDGTIGLEMQYIDGEPLMKPNMTPGEVRSGLSTLVDLQRGIHQHSGDGFPLQVEQIKIKIDRNTSVEPETKAQLLRLLETLIGEELVLCHGDFHPFNVIKDGDAYWIIDWVDASSGNPKGEVCRVYLILKQFASGLAEGYLDVFCQKSGFAKADILAWMPIMATTRLTEGGFDEQALKMLMDMIDDWKDDVSSSRS